jgi:hypothetical protein
MSKFDKLFEESVFAKFAEFIVESKLAPEDSELDRYTSLLTQVNLKTGEGTSAISDNFNLDEDVILPIKKIMTNSISQLKNSKEDSAKKMVDALSAINFTLKQQGDSSIYTIFFDKNKVAKWWQLLKKAKSKYNFQDNVIILTMAFDTKADTVTITPNPALIPANILKQTKFTDIGTNPNEKDAKAKISGIIQTIMKSIITGSQEIILN